jgi:hypothetical protein
MSDMAISQELPCGRTALLPLKLFSLLHSVPAIDLCVGKPNLICHRESTNELPISWDASGPTT